MAVSDLHFFGLWGHAKKNRFSEIFLICNQGNKLSGQMRKTALCLTPQAV